VAEDNPVNQRVVAFQLKKLGCEATIVSTGRDVIQALSEHRFDLVFMDCQMPDMDGFQTTAEIRRLESGLPSGSRHLPIVAMTANALEGDRQRCLAAGMDDYISKPVKLQDLGAMIDRWTKDISVSPVDLALLEEITSNDPKQMESLLALFMEETTKALHQLRVAVSAEDARQVRELAHGSAGAGSLYGMVGLVGILRNLEKLGKEGHLQGASDLLNMADQEFGRIQTFVKDSLSKGPPRSETA
jgi:CheY-like chemotaxis protein